MRTYGEVEVYLNLSWPQHQMELSGQLYAPAALPPGKKPQVPIA
jgi:hypothetical protein